VISSALQERAVDWATRFAFSEVASLLHEFSGSALLSEDTVWRLCQRAAARHDTEQAHVIAATQQQSEEELPSPCFVAVADTYDGQEKEFIALTDAICVSSQKPTRQKRGQERVEKTAKRHDTDVFVLPCKDGRERFFCEGTGEKWSCVSAVSAFLRRE
jgi:hypothetical protein